VDGAAVVVTGMVGVVGVAESFADERVDLRMPARDASFLSFRFALVTRLDDVGLGGIATSCALKEAEPRMDGSYALSAFSFFVRSSLLWFCAHGEFLLLPRRKSKCRSCVVVPGYICRL
jgi:hypothetical protein